MVKREKVGFEKMNRPKTIKWWSFFIIYHFNFAICVFIFVVAKVQTIPFHFIFHLIIYNQRNHHLIYKVKIQMKEPKNISYLFCFYIWLFVYLLFRIMW